MLLADCELKQKKLLLLAIDGARPDAMLFGNRFRQWISGRGVRYQTQCKVLCRTSMSAPCWTTLLTGSLESEHGISTNEQLESDSTSAKNQKTILATYRQEGKRVATLVSSWSGMHHLVKKDSDNHEFYPYSSSDKGAKKLRQVIENDQQVASRVVQLVESKNFDVIFAYFMSVDETGHQYGFGLHIKKYIDAIQNMDRLLAMILKLNLQDWMVAATTDHGGSDWHSLTSTQRKDICDLWKYPANIIERYVPGIHGLILETMTRTFMVFYDGSEHWKNMEIQPQPSQTDFVRLLLQYSQESGEKRMSSSKRKTSAL